MNEARILIVEDELIVAADLRERLQRMGGYQVVGMATESGSAVALAEALRPDLVLMDIRLAGGTDGIAAAQEIGQRFHLPCIFLSAYSEEATLERARLAEPFGYLLKPFADRELRANIEMALYKHRAETALREQRAALEAALAKVKLLSGLLPICAGCKQIRDPQGHWTQVENYVQDHSEATFSHGLCPACLPKYFPEDAGAMNC